ncbi:phospholipase domain-containing protein [Streptomyces sp. NPDC004435]|uniref:phospholipase domain-containing protein n=1 Tax=Streptomyces sp. NPDC004435 TaxID=3364701 RepID=UPI003697B343
MPQHRPRLGLGLGEVRHLDDGPQPLPAPLHRRRLQGRPGDRGGGPLRGRAGFREDRRPVQADQHLRRPGHLHHPLQRLPHGRPWTCTVTAGSSREDWFDAVAYADGWYDFTVLADVDGTWSRRHTGTPVHRHTGHIETGAPSVTG